MHYGTYFPPFGTYFPAFGTYFVWFGTYFGGVGTYFLWFGTYFLWFGTYLPYLMVPTLSLKATLVPISPIAWYLFPTLDLVGRIPKSYLAPEAISGTYFWGASNVNKTKGK